jgi:hypothetical protein
MIDFLEEHLVVKTKLDFPNRDPDGHYQLRKRHLENIFNDNIEYISATYTA